MKAKVSIITPFLNAAPFLQEAIASVQGQTFCDWELLLIDDGSTDDSGAIAALAASRDPRIKFIRRPAEVRGGAAAARNIGVRAASGEFIAFLDADDVYETRMLETYVAALVHRPAVAMVYGPSRWWYPEDPCGDWIESMSREAGRTYQPPSLLVRIILLQMGEVPCPCSVLTRSAAVRAVGGFEEQFRLYEDQTLWVKLLLRFPTHVLNYCGARYRQHQSSTSARAIAEGMYDPWRPHPARATFLEWVKDHVVDAGLQNRRLNLAIRLAQVPYVEETGLNADLYRVAWQGSRAAKKLQRRLHI